MGKDNVKDIKNMISILVGESHINNNTRYAFEALHEKGLITETELLQIKNQMQSKKGLVSY